MTEYRITCYCYKCNGNNDETKSQEAAKANYTAACHPSKYDNLKNKKIDIEGVGIRWIKDVYKESLPDNRIDVYVGKTSKCNCVKHDYNGNRKVTIYNN